MSGDPVTNCIRTSCLVYVRLNRDHTTRLVNQANVIKLDDLSIKIVAIFDLQ